VCSPSPDALESGLAIVAVVADEARELLEVVQEPKFLTTYTMRDGSGREPVRLRRNYLYNVVRVRWYCDRPDGIRLGRPRKTQASCRCCGD
jgi:hypothetical protein